MLIQEHEWMLKMLYSCNKSFNVLLVRTGTWLLSRDIFWNTDLRADALVLLMWIPGEYFCVLVCPLGYSFRLSLWSVHPLEHSPYSSLLTLPVCGRCSGWDCGWMWLLSSRWLESRRKEEASHILERGRQRTRKRKRERQHSQFTNVDAVMSQDTDVWRSCGPKGEDRKLPITGLLGIDFSL